MALLIALWLAATPFARPTPAPPPDALVVQLRDVRGAGVPDIAVLVLDHGGGTVLARATTDANGVARIPSLPSADVRVAVRGALPDGSALRLPGQDARGIALTLGIPPARLDLRVEADGTITPDPATMIAPDVGVPIVDDAIPTTVPAPTAQLRASPTLAAVASEAASERTDTKPDVVAFIPLLVLVLIAVILAVAFCVELRRAR